MSATKTDGNDWEHRFRTRMVKLRNARGMTQTDLARALEAFPGLKLGHQQTIARIEAGDRPVRLGEAPFIAQVLGTTVHAMVAAENSDEELELSLEVFFREVSGLHGALADFAPEFDGPSRAAYALHEQANSQEASLDEAVSGGSLLALRIRDSVAGFNDVMRAWDTLLEAVRALEAQPYELMFLPTIEEVIESDGVDRKKA